MNPPKQTSILWLAIFGLLTGGFARAAVIVNLPTPSTAGSIQFTQDINFTVTTAGSFRFIVFDEWVTSDGTSTNFSDSNFTPGSLSYQINGGSVLTAALAAQAFNDNNNTTQGGITPNDGSLRLASNISLNLGDVFTLKAATYVLAAGSLPSNFNAATQQTFNGNAFLSATGGGTILTAGTSVGLIPEPSRALLSLGGLSALLLRRRRRAGHDAMA